MKKLFIVILSLFLTINMARAEAEYGFKGPLNFIQCKILEKTIASQLENKYNGNADIKIKSYGAKALRNGIFKSANLKLDNIIIKEIPISYIELETISTENKLDITNVKNINLISTIDAQFTALLSNENLKQILNSNIYQNEIAKINSQLAPYITIDIKDIYCENGRLFIKLQANSFGIKMATTTSSEVVTENGEIILKDIKLGKIAKNIFSTSIYTSLEGLNPFKTTIKALGNSNLNIKPSAINIVNDKIKISGMIKIYKD